jgi:hypothetical protein
MPEVAMSASVHSSFLSLDDALISVSCTAYDRFAVGLSAILAILDDVALVVCDNYSTGVIHLHKFLCSFSHACASFFFHDAWPRWMQYWLMSISR